MMGMAVYGVIFRKVPLEHAVLAKADAKGADPQFGFRAFQRPERNPFTACGGLHLLRGRRAFAQEAPQEPLGVLSGTSPIRSIACERGPMSFAGSKERFPPSSLTPFTK